VARARLVNRKLAMTQEFPCRVKIGAYIIRRFVPAGGVMSRSSNPLVRRIRAAAAALVEALRDVLAPPARPIPIPVRVRPRRDRR
jgi:hypothetical protein